MRRAAVHWVLRRLMPLSATVIVAVSALLWLPVILDLAALLLPGRGMDLALDWVRNLGPVGLAAATYAETDRWRRSYERKQSLAVQPGVQSTVERPDELEAIVAGVVGPSPAGKTATTVGLTTGVHGAGGFGKTTLARMVCADPRIRDRFGGNVTWVTLGRDVVGNGDLAAKVNEVIVQVGPEDVVAASTDAGEAGRQLAYVLSQGPPRLLVIDDVWRLRQLEPFLLGAKHCVRLVTTRNQELMVGRGLSIRVDQMTEKQARRLLTGGLAGSIDGPVQDGLLAATGRWALLLSLVNRILASAEQTGVRDLSAYAKELCTRIETRGPAAVDAVGDGARGLDVTDSRQRAEAVQATVTASTGLLEPDELVRLRELTIFAEDAAIPLDLIGRLWEATAGLSDLDARALGRRLAGLGLITLTADDGGRVGLHDVLRDYLRQSIPPEDLAKLHSRLLELLSADLPRLDDGEIAWWQLDAQHRYLWDHVVEHLRGADGPAAAERLATDLRWAATRLWRSGPDAPQADLVAAGTPRALRMRQVWAHSAYLLAPTRPQHSVSDILVAALGADPDWAPSAAQLTVGDESRPRLRLRDPFPPPAPGLRFALTGPGAMVYALRVAPDGSWLAAARDRIIRIWDTTTGLERGVFTHDRYVTPMDVAPDGSWIAAGYADNTARIWNVATGQPMTEFTRHEARVADLVVGPGGQWVATRDVDRVLRVWRPDTGRESVHNFEVTTMAAMPDGRVVFGRSNGEIRLSAVPAIRQPALRGHTGAIDQITVAPDGTWLASTGSDETVRIWDVATMTERARITGWYSTVAASPDSRTLLVGASVDGSLRSFDAYTGEELRSFPGHTGAIYAITFAPDGTWFASAGDDGTIRLWDASGSSRGVLKGHSRWVGDLVISPDGTWLASSSVDGTIRVWDPADAETPPPDPVNRIVAAGVSPDGRTAMLGRHHTAYAVLCATADLAATVRELEREPYTVAVANDGSVAYTPARGKGLWLEDPAGAAVVLDEEAGDGHLRFSHDGRFLAAVEAGGRLRVWDRGTRRLVLERADVSTVAFFPEEPSLFVVTSDLKSTVVDLDGTARGEYGPYLSRIWAAAVAPVTAIAAAGDGAGYSWLNFTRETGAGYLEGFDDPIEALAFDPTGLLVVAGGEEGLVAVWYVGERQPLASFRLPDKVLAVSWNDDGIAVVTYGGVYRLGFHGTVFPPSASPSSPSSPEPPAASSSSSDCDHESP